MSKFLLTLAIAAATLVAGQAAQAAPWIFQRSYYSHDPVVDVKIGPDRYQFDGPYFSRPQGAYIRSGFSQTQSINIGGQGSNNSIYYESWFQGGVEY